MGSTWVVVGIVVFYMALLALIGHVVRRSSRTSKSFTDGGKSFAAILIAFLMASEFVGTSAIIGTAQEAYTGGLSAAWNIAALGVGFVLFSFFLAQRFKALGEITISGALARFYGEKVRTATSIIMICALLIVAVATYAGGGAILANLLDIDQSFAILLVGVLSTVYVTVGGMRSVVYTNLLHAVVMVGGIALLATVGTFRAGGLTELRAALPADMFEVDGVGWAQIFAWLIAGVGAVFATQYVVQAIVTVDNPQKARQASLYSAVVLIPYGLLAAVVGITSAVLYPDIESIDALPRLAVDLNPVLSGLAIAGLAAAMFGTIAALMIGSSTLLLKDFYQPFFNRAQRERNNLVFVRVATVIMGVIPITLALSATDVLAVSFLAKSLRAALAVLVVMMFLAPRFGTPRGAFISIIASLFTTVSWYLAGNPYGIDNAYIAFATPIMIMVVSHLMKGKSEKTSGEPDVPGTSLSGLAHKK